MVLLAVAFLFTICAPRTSGMIPPKIYCDESKLSEREIVSEKLVIMSAQASQVILTCNSSHPIEWDYIGMFTVDFEPGRFSRKRIVDPYNPENKSSTIFQVSAKVSRKKFWGEGRLICKSVVDPNVSDSIFLTTGFDGRFQLQNKTKIYPRLDEPEVFLLCDFSFFDDKPHPSLLMPNAGLIAGENITDRSNIRYDSVKAGFYIDINSSEFQTGRYECQFEYKSFKLYIPFEMEEPLEHIYSPESSLLGGMEIVRCSSTKPIRMMYGPNGHRRPFLIQGFTNHSSPYKYNAEVTIVEWDRVSCRSNVSGENIKYWFRVSPPKFRFKLSDYSQGKLDCGGGSADKLEQFGCQDSTECNFIPTNFKNQWTGRFSMRELENPDSSYILTPKPLFARCSENRGGILYTETNAFLLDLDRNYFLFDKNTNFYTMTDKLVRLEEFQRKAYLFEEINCTCIAARYPFSPVHWAFHYKNGSVIIQKDFEIGANDKIEYPGFVQLRSTLLTLNDMNIAAVSCYAPFWNSFDWAIATRNITVLAQSKPHIANSESVQLAETSMGNEELRLTCDVDSHPPAVIKWENAGNDSRTESIEKDGKILSVLILAGRVSAEEADYVCIAENLFGITTKAFRVYKPRAGLLSPGMIAAICVVILAIIVVVVLLFLRQRRILAVIRNQLSEKDIQDFLEGTASGNDASPNSQRFPEEYKIDRNSFSYDSANLLGFGAYGLVYMGELQPTAAEIREKRNSGKMFIAIKTVQQSTDVQYVRSLLTEIKTMAFVGPHDNIVRFIGACVENIQKNEIFALLEFCHNGSLDTLLKSKRSEFQIRDISEIQYTNTHPDGKISTRNLLLWAQQIAEALIHLAEKNVIHGDLATRNILITKNLTAKVADFGLAKQLYNYSEYKRKAGQRLPWAWMAIESLRDMEFSVRSDVWSYGVTLWEIFTLAQTPYGGLGFTMEFINMLELGLRLPKPEYASEQIYQVMADCWHTNPKGRPTIEAIANILKVIGRSATVEKRSKY